MTTDPKSDITGGLIAQLLMHAGASDTHIPRPLLKRAADELARYKNSRLVSHAEPAPSAASGLGLLLETTVYPEPPSFVRNKDDYITGCMAYRDALKQAIRSHQAPVGEGWISVKERLPETGQGVILCADGHVEWGYYRGNYAGKGRPYRGTHGMIYKEVTHWMPLPPAPEKP